MTWLIAYLLGAVLWISGMTLVSELTEADASQRARTWRRVVRDAPIWPAALILVLLYLAVTFIEHGDDK